VQLAERRLEAELEALERKVTCEAEDAANHERQGRAKELDNVRIIYPHTLSAGSPVYPEFWLSNFVLAACAVQSTPQPYSLGTSAGWVMLQSNPCMAAVLLQAQPPYLCSCRSSGVQLCPACKDVSRSARTTQHVIQRGQMLSQLRVRLGALSRAFSRRSDDARVSHEAHRIALATLALQAALEQASRLCHHQCHARLSIGVLPHFSPGLHNLRNFSNDLRTCVL
jgi:hypothetical protein